MDRPRSRQAAEQLLVLINEFPTSNDSQNSGDEGTDMQALLKGIRSKYRVLCATTFLRPRIASAETSL